MGRIRLFLAGIIFGTLSAHSQLLHEGFESAALMDSISYWEHIPGWRIDDWAGSTARMAITDTVQNSGKRSLYIDILTASGTNPVEVYLANWVYPVTVGENKILEISFYARGSKSGQKVGLDLKHPGAWDNLASEVFTLTDSFARYSIEYNVYSQQDFGIYMNFAWAEGDAYWVDDIRFDSRDMPASPVIDTAFYRSDIVFTDIETETLYKQFNTGLIGWGWLPRPLTAQNITLWRGTVQNVHAAGIKYQARIEVDAGWRNMIDYDPAGFSDDIVITLGGTKLIHPWFADRTHKGYPSYYFCTNATGFQKFIRAQVEAAVSGSPESIMFDSQTGTPLPVNHWGGCFCEHCMKGFREYLEGEYTAPELLALGITDIHTFDYGNYLEKRGWNEARYKSESYKGNPGIPLFNDFRVYQRNSLNDLVGAMSQYADSLAGKHIPFSTSSPPDAPFKSVLIPEISHYTEELVQDAPSLEVPFKPVLNYSMAEALGKGMMLTGSPQKDWNTVFAKDRPALIRSWIIQAYSYGANFMVPIRQWAGAYDFYDANPDEFEYIYDFIHKHAGLFDGYRLYANTGLLLPYKGLRFSHNPSYNAIQGLIENNIPFNLVMAGDDWWEKELEEWDLKRFDAIVKTSDQQYLDTKQSGLVNAWSHKSVQWPDTAALFQVLPRQIQVSAGNSRLTVIPRENSLSPDVPYVLHLVNREYEEASISMDTLKDFYISLQNSLFSRDIIGATLFRPQHDSLELELDSISGGFSLHIPELADWGIIRLRSGIASRITFRIFERDPRGDIHPLDLAEISTDRQHLRTDETGTVEMMQVPGEIGYQVQRRGYSSVTGRFTFTGDTTIHDTIDHITYNVTVLVKDAGTLQAIEGAVVSLESDEKETDTSGSAHFTGIDYGSYKLGASMEHYNGYSGSSIEIFSDTLLIIDMDLKQYLVNFHVGDSASGDDLSAAQVEFAGQSEETRFNGLASFYVPFGSYNYLVTMTDRDTAGGQITVLRDTNHAVKLSRITGNIGFRIISDGDPVYKAIIILDDDTLLTNSVGIAGLEGIRLEKTYDYTITKQGLQDCSGSIFHLGDTIIEVRMLSTGKFEDIHTGIRVYPNPAGEILVVEGLEPGARIEIIGVDGSVLITEIASGIVHYLNTGAVRPGIYILRLQSVSGQPGNIRFIKK